jgi:CBS domain-containing protein
MTSTAIPRNPLDYVNESFKKRLVETAVKTIIPRWESLIIARSTDTISTVFSRLIDNKIFSMPMLDVATNKYIAFVDLFDILAYVVEVLQLPIDKDEAWVLSSQFQNTSAITLVGRSTRSSWNLIAEEAPLQHAINQLQRVHRLAVVDSQGNLTAMVTQYRVGRWLANRSDWVIGDLATMTVEDFRLGYKSTGVVTVNETDRPVDAFMKMYNQDVSGVAVLDNMGSVVGNISVSDLKEIGYNGGMFKKLYGTVKEFLNRKTYVGLHVPILVWVDRYDTIKKVLETFRDYRVHRIYYVSSGFHRPLGVITFSDIMAMLATRSQGIGA